MKNQSIDSQKLLVGALLGAIVGGAALMLLRSNNNKKIPKDLLSKYDEIKERIGEYIDGIETQFSKNVKDPTGEWVERAKESLENVKDGISSFQFSEYKELGAGLLIGLLLGGAGAHFASCAQKKGSPLSSLNSTISNWKPLVDDIQELLEKYSETKSKKGTGEGKLNDALDLAFKGLKIWNTLKKKN